MDPNDDQPDQPSDKETDGRRRLEELSEENLVALFQSTEKQREKALALMQQIARALVSRDNMTIMRVSKLLDVSRPTIYMWLKKR